MSESIINSHSDALEKRLDEIGWGSFLALMGGLLLVPDETVPRGVWFIAVGAIVVGVNVARYLNHIKINWFIAVLGLFALAAGVTALFGVQLPIFAILLVVLGGGILFRPLFRNAAHP
jgi:hypothetical protein